MSKRKSDIRTPVAVVILAALIVFVGLPHRHTGPKGTDPRESRESEDTPYSVTSSVGSDGPGCLFCALHRLLGHADIERVDSAELTVPVSSVVLPPGAPLVRTLPPTGDPRAPPSV